MSKIITIPFTEDFIERLADYIDQEYLKKGKDLRKVALVFGGQRPYLFLKRALAKRMKKAFYPPVFFTIDQWMTNIVNSNKSTRSISQLDHCYLIYQLAAKHTPQLLEGRTRFASFLPWAQEILSLIDQLDLESAPEDALKHLKAEAQIGFDVPDGISRLLESLFVLRRVYHEYLLEHQIAARGFQYDQASQLIETMDLSGWDEILFCNFFYLHRSEMKVLKHCYTHANTTLLIQGDQRRWPALSRIGALLGQDILEGDRVIEGDFKLRLHAAFDVHSQAAVVANILQFVSDPEKAVIVLPQSEAILPLLSAISSIVQEFNISMGYPLKRSALYALLERVLTAQRSRQESLYYTRDYLRVLHHSMVKNLYHASPQVSRVLMQKIEEILTGQIMTDFSGQLFLDLDVFCRHERVYEETLASLKLMNVTVTREELSMLLAQVHRVLFQQWHEATTFNDLRTYCLILRLSCNSQS